VIKFFFNEFSQQSASTCYYSGKPWRQVHLDERANLGKPTVCSKLIFIQQLFNEFTPETKTLLLDASCFWA